MRELPKLVVDFNEVDKDDIALVGGKGANLGEMAKVQFPIPPGFIVTTLSYKRFLEVNNFNKRIEEILEQVDPNSPKLLQGVSEQIDKLFKKGTVPKEIAHEIIKSYRKLGGLFKKALVAVRSSATAEDLPSASFAGQQATFLNVQGEAYLIESIKDCWASLFTPRAIFYRAQHKIPHKKVLIAVIVQEMVQSEISGVAFTVDPVTGDKNALVIEAIWGLGELIVQGSVMPDRYRLRKDNLTLLSVEVAGQEVELVRVGSLTKQKRIPKSRQNRRKLTDSKIKELAQILDKIHNHYYFPQDIEWAFAKGRFYIVQTRPVTTLENQKLKIKDQNGKWKMGSGKLILKGIPASPGISTGRVVKVKSPKELDKVKEGDILVTRMTSPDFVPVMRRAVGIVTDEGGQTSHAAIVSRELGIPCVVGTKNATSFLTEGLVVTVDGARGVVYKGGGRLPDGKILPSYQTQENIKTATKLYVNLAEPDKAQEIALLDVDGIGLFRAEFMMAQIGIHPKKAIQDKKTKEYVGRLAQSMTKMCEPFYPRPVVYRTTDFKTNEYRNLKGGEKFEPIEPNPMLGFRGAFRYIRDSEVFELELRAIKKVRDDGLKNLWIMIPFVRSPQEFKAVKSILYRAGLTRSPTLKLWLMIELPVNVILINEFAKVGIDGVSIGSNDLTMLILGTDRDNQEVAPAFTELSPAVLWAIERVVKYCGKNGISSSICGQAPSVHDSLVEQLVEWGITSISVNQDAVQRVREIIYNAERKIAKR